MRTMNKFFAVAFAIIAVMAFYGAAYCNAPWHYVTTIACILISTLFAADSGTPQKPGVSGR